MLELWFFFILLKSSPFLWLNKSTKMQLFSLFIYLFILRLEQSVLSRSVRIKLTQLVEGESQTQMCRVCVITRLHGSRRAFSIQRRWHHATVVFFFRGLFSDSPLSGKSWGRVQLQSDKWRWGKKSKKNGFLCVPIAVAQAGGAKESELVGLWREAVTLQLHVPLQPVNAGFVGKKKGRCKSAPNAR